MENYQGEENRIILLSLVRNNEKNNIGYLTMKNRICVALSRSREGLFIIGNQDLLAQCSETWKSICKKLKSQKSIDEILPLQCEKHNTLIEIKTPGDFKSVNEYGGCDLDCGSILDCGHLCTNKCHTDIFDHECDICKF